MAGKNHVPVTVVRKKFPEAYEIDLFKITTLLIMLAFNYVHKELAKSNRFWLASFDFHNQISALDKNVRLVVRHNGSTADKSSGVSSVPG